MKQEKIIISKNSLESSEPSDIVYSNVTVVNLLLAEGWMSKTFITMR